MAMPFGFLGHMARMLPGYVEGERQAVSDNWNDLNQLNNVMGGQIRNQFALDTYGNQIARDRYATNNAMYNESNNEMANQLNMQRFPTQQMAITAESPGVIADAATAHQDAMRLRQAQINAMNAQSAQQRMLGNYYANLMNPQQSSQSTATELAASSGNLFPNLNSQPTINGRQFGSVAIPRQNYNWMNDPNLFYTDWLNNPTS